MNSPYDFCLRYFKTVGATIRKSSPNTLCVELPRDVDKELTDRPFFWKWAEIMHEEPPNTVLYLKFSSDADETDKPAEVRSEVVRPGCYRLLRIISSARTRGMFAVAFEELATVLTPYALFVVKVSFVSDRRMDFLESYAINLQNDHICGDAMNTLTHRQLTDEQPIHSQIKDCPMDIDHIFQLITHCIEMDIQMRDHTWEDEASVRLKEELAKLDAYYDAGEQEDQAPELSLPVKTEQEMRRAEIIWRIQPKIEIRPTQFALVYLAETPCS